MHLSLTHTLVAIYENGKLTHAVAAINVRILHNEELRSQE